MLECLKIRKTRYEAIHKLVTISRPESTKEELVLVEPESVEEVLVLLEEGSATSSSREKAW